MIYTSYFHNVKAVLGIKPEIRFCSIAGKTPDWFKDLNNDLNLKAFKCPELMPKRSWWNVWHDKFKDNLGSEESKNWYTEAYTDVLNKLNPKKIQNKLYELSDHNDVCLLCYETPDKFCHRQLVSNWFNENGIDCFEFNAVLKLAITKDDCLFSAS